MYADGVPSFVYELRTGKPGLLYEVVIFINLTQSNISLTVQTTLYR